MSRTGYQLDTGVDKEPTNTGFLTRQWSVEDGLKK
jgi:hypothetical protein